MTTRFLLDTQILIAMLERRFERDFPGHAAHVMRDAAPTSVSVVSLWEIAIKTRIGKLSLDAQPVHIARFCLNAGFALLAISVDHAVAIVDPDPPMKDPFDRLLLAQAQVEGMRLVTTDHALAAHPLAFKP
jgi:PIN domain nuclease of toxin-antitoxin system